MYTQLKHFALLDLNGWLFVWALSTGKDQFISVPCAGASHGRNNLHMPGTVLGAAHHPSQRVA